MRYNIKVDENFTFTMRVQIGNTLAFGHMQQQYQKATAYGH